MLVGYCAHCIFINCTYSLHAEKRSDHPRGFKRIILKHSYQGTEYCQDPRPPWVILTRHSPSPPTRRTTTALIFMTLISFLSIALTASVCAPKQHSPVMPPLNLIHMKSFCGNHPRLPLSLPTVFLRLTSAAVAGHGHCPRVSR